MLNKYQILTLVILALLCVSCDKDYGASTKDTSGAASYNEQDWNWNKQPSSGFQEVPCGSPLKNCAATYFPSPRTSILVLL